jgi:hypothetical protein
MNSIMTLPQQDIDIRKWLKENVRELSKAIFKVDPFCDVDQPDWQQLECGSELGGVVAIGLVKPGEDVGATDAAKIINLEEETWWSNGAGASPQTHWIMKSTRGSLPAGTPIEEEGYGLTSVQRTGDDRELSFEIQGVMDNRNFVAATNKRSGWGLVYVTAGKDSSGGYQAFYVENVSIYMSDLIEQSIKTQKRWAGSAKWSTDMTPGLPFIAPASIFIGA